MGGEEGGGGRGGGEEERDRNMYTIFDLCDQSQ